MKTKKVSKKKVTKAQLWAKHGSPAQFAKAVRDCLGEISLEEAVAAIDQYCIEWANAYPPTRRGPSRLDRLVALKTEAHLVYNARLNLEDATRLNRLVADQSPPGKATAGHGS